MIDKDDPIATQAFAALALARSAQASKVTVEITRADGPPLTTIEVEREFEIGTAIADGMTEVPIVTAERVTIRQGSKSRPKIVLAVPAAWLE